MITLTRTIRHQATLRSWLTQQWSARRWRRAQAQDTSTEWFTLQAENDQDGRTCRVLASSPEVVPVREPGNVSSNSGQAIGDSSEPKLSRMIQGLGNRRFVLAAIVGALIATLAFLAIAVNGRDANRGRQALAAQRIEITRLARQRDQAFTAARQARAREAGYRTQAARWRSRALARRQPRARRSRRARRDIRRR